jgi:ASPIC and UnbV/FG-GAP-like repeat
MEWKTTSGAWRRGLVYFVLVSVSFAAAMSTEAEITFTDVSTAAGFTAKSVSWGASWGDVNGDGHPDLFLNNHARKSSIYLNNASEKFTNAIAQLDAEGYLTGVGAHEDTHGAVWVDFDNDGDQDLVVSTGICCNVQFMVNMGGKLYNRAAQYGFASDADLGGRMPIWFDADDDGLLETTLLSFYPAQLLKQSRGVFVNAKTGTGYACNRNEFGSLIDLNNDGVLELVCVTTGGPFAQAWNMASRPWLNVTSSLPGTTNVQDVIIGDFDRNLRNDMLLLRGAQRPSEVVAFNGNQIEAQFVNNDRSFRFKSNGVLQVRLDWNKDFVNFTNINIGQNGIHPSSNTFTLDPSNTATHGLKARNPATTNTELFVGYDPGTQTWTFQQYWANTWTYSYIELTSSAAITNLVATGIQAGFDTPLTPVLLLNLPEGMTDRTAASNLNAKVHCGSGIAGDFDNDMDQDIFLVCRGGVQNIADILLENDGHGVFRAVAGAGGATGPIGMAVAQGAGTGESVVSADYDLDGRLDFLVTNGLNMRPYGRNNGPYQLFRNTSPLRNWVEIDLLGTTSNRDAIGAKVFATAGGVTQVREQNEGYHRWSQNQRRLHFGLADNISVNLRVEWPSGHTDTYTVPAGHIYVATEATGIRQASF